MAGKLRIIILLHVELVTCNFHFWEPPTSSHLHDFQILGRVLETSFLKSVGTDGTRQNLKDMSKQFLEILNMESISSEKHEIGILENLEYGIEIF